MQKSLTVGKYLMAVFCVLAVLGLLGWYFFLKTRTDATNTDNTARGIDTAAPSFTGSTGSTHENIVQSTENDIGIKVVENASTPPELWRVSSNPIAGMGFVRE